MRKIFCSCYDYVIFVLAKLCYHIYIIIIGLNYTYNLQNVTIYTIYKNLYDEKEKYLLSLFQYIMLQKQYMKKKTILLKSKNTAQYRSNNNFILRARARVCVCVCVCMEWTIKIICKALKNNE